jgi:acetolactate synthase-1/2/3 large subunit
MKIKVSNYISQFLVDNGIKDVFTITGGGAMHLNDALGHQKGLKCIYNHHEQACSIAAESYARINNKIAAVCVTTGPGGTNAITGVVGGYLDSIPMLILSGQVRYDTTVRSTGLKLRSLGDQEFDICSAVNSMTKYCEMVIDPYKIKYCLEKALYIATHGRPGPCWLDIPLNVQGAYIETDNLESFDPKEYNKTIAPKVTEDIIDKVIKKIKEAKRPVLYAGSGIRTSNGYDTFIKLIKKLNIPIVTAWNSIDAIYDDYPLYVGRGGIMGDRPGNFAVQNSDLVLSIGCRLSIRQVGYNWKTWAREAYIIDVDIDKEELKKPTIKVDLPIWADAKDFLEELNKKVTTKLFNNKEWLQTCSNWKKNYPVVLPKHYKIEKNTANVYCFIKELSNSLKEKQITVVGNGSACVVGSHAYTIKKGQRFIINSAIAAMGYDLPAAIGACIANNKKEIICITGDGSIQMNIQELQTIIHHKLPIKIFLINNGGYHSIRQTQKNFFGEPLVGIGKESKDLSFPDMSKLAPAYGYPYYKITSNKNITKKIQEVLKEKGPFICEVFVSSNQFFEPKSATKRLEDGTLVSAPLEDLAPFLPKEELEKNMIIPLIK